MIERREIDLAQKRFIDEKLSELTYLHALRQTPNGSVIAQNSRDFSGPEDPLRQTPEELDNISPSDLDAGISGHTHILPS